ncbi:MAG: class I SAM-dependent methyltransferase [Bdellovibrionaceae bacterium]|nr:class I SAM-dependent methyltransferase [Bdellovibrionales bacterium]MCB9085922.1 class I SAM-dependent methyltransferase [Pseudobdellovibrionaceae bacterium]
MSPISNHPLAKKTVIHPPFSLYSGIQAHFESQRTTRIWDELLGIQAEVTKNEDLKFFFNSQAFKSAKKVLDFGCGPGDLIRTLLAYFPDKQYTGVDLSSDYIEFAAQRFSEAENVEFICDDIFSYSKGSYDVVILRLVVQHIKDNRKLLDKLKRILNPGGSVVVIDTMDSMKCFSHPVLELSKMYKALQSKQKGERGSRNAICEIESYCGELGYRLRSSYEMPVTAISEEEIKRMSKMFMFASEIVSRKFAVNVNQFELFRQLAHWQQQPGAYAQIGMKYLELTFLRTS